MTRSRRLSDQAINVLAVLHRHRDDWSYGLEISGETGLKSGSLYPLLIRLHERGLLESQWLAPQRPGRPARHGYRLTNAGREALAANRRQATALSFTPKEA